jgi:hypothetical protein
MIFWQYVLLLRSAASVNEFLEIFVIYCFQSFVESFCKEYIINRDSIG